MPKLTLADLRAGTRFRAVPYCDFEATLVKLTPGCALVEVEVAGREFSAEVVGVDGETEKKDVKITGGRKRVTISLGTEVEVVEGVVARPDGRRRENKKKVAEGA